jgi:DNA-binding transcriptional LysR family regulator
MDSEIELRHLRYFVAVAEELHFGRAARRLNLAQPPLSQQIRRLESLLGHALFTRTSRAVRLTSAGEALLERARNSLEKLAQGLEEVRSVGRGEVGYLKVGFIGSGMLTSLPAMLGRYRRRYPQVNLHLREAHSAAVIQAIQDRTIDCGFLRDGGPAEGLEVETLYEEPFVAVLPSKHPLARRRILSTNELRDDDFVFFPAVASRLAYAKALSLFEEHGFRPRIVQEAPQWLTILRLVGAGLGVTVAPSCVAQIAAPEVVCIPIRSPVKSEIELAWRASEDRAIVVKFCEMARAGFSRATRKS